MELSLSTHNMTSSRGIDECFMTTLTNAVKQWRVKLENFNINESLDSIFHGLTVNGRHLREYFNIRSLLRVVEALKTASVIINHGPELLRDVIGIVCLLAVMSSDLVQWFKGDDAEEACHRLLDNNGLLQEMLRTSYGKHQEAYDLIFVKLCALVAPAGIAFCVPVAATIFSKFVWPRRRSIARFIAVNWKPIATGLTVAALIAGLVAVVYGLYKYFVPDGDDD